MGKPTIVADSFLLAAEIANNPPVPDVNSIQLYAKDVAGVTHWFSQDHAGNVVDLTLATAIQAAFSAHKNGTDQTGVADATFTAITFGTEVYDIGGFFASNTWTPPAGIVSLTASAAFSGTIAAGALVAVAIYKNGSIFKQSLSVAVATLGGSTVTCQDSANGTDAYTVQGFVDVTSGTGTISGSTSLTYFMGSVVR